MPVVFQGERGAFSELAAKQFFSSRRKTMPAPEFADVFNCVSNKKAKYGILPIENALTGSIHQVYDLFLDYDLFIIGEIYLRVSHFLIANRGVSRRTIRRVYTHPQALAQCKKYLEKYDNLKKIPVSDTAGAVKMIKEKGYNDSAAIASMQAAIDYDMNILTKSIEDNKMNMTRFLILSRRSMPRNVKKNKMKTSVVFSTKNIPGALFKALSVFALRDIDLLKIESRPAYGRNFAYLFYLDFEGDAESEAQQNAINHLKEITTLCRVLGSYPEGVVAHPEYGKRTG